MPWCGSLVTFPGWRQSSVPSGARSRGNHSAQKETGVDNFIKENQGTPVPQMAGQNSPGQGQGQAAKQGQGQGKGNGSY